MKAAPLMATFPTTTTPALAQNSPEDNDKRKVEAYLYELTPLKSDPSSAASLKLPRGHRFVAPHGSWNRKPTSGHELARLRFDASGWAVWVKSFVSGYMSRNDTGNFAGRAAWR